MSMNWIILDTAHPDYADALVDLESVNAAHQLSKLSVRLRNDGLQALVKACDADADWRAAQAWGAGLVVAAYDTPEDHETHVVPLMGTAAWEQVAT